MLAAIHGDYAVDFTLGVLNAIMDYENLRTFPLLGFLGGISIGTLQKSCDQVVAKPGVYVVVRDSEARPRFLRVSKGGHFKGRNPTAPVAELRERWLSQPKVLYIGKAGGSSKRVTLQHRLRQYMRFGLGQPCAHWGGRHIWQLPDAKNLLVYWKPTPGRDPRLVEKAMLSKFVAKYGCLPYANLAR